MYKTVGMISLGCAKNQVDAEVMLGILTQGGYEIVSKSQDADIIIVNTCGFIGPAKEESIEAILEQAQYKRSGSCRILIVAGCLAERYKNELVEEIPEIDAVVGTGSYMDIINVIDECTKRENKIWAQSINCDLPDDLPRVLTTAPYTAYLKIAEGCDNHCTYCIIPKLRGKFRSRNLDGLLKEANFLAQSGVKELIVVAQDITRYGQDLGDDISLVVLLRELCKIPGILWIRLLYCYPDRISDELLDLISQENKICKYLDIPIQHISETILRKMNRKFTADEIKVLLNKIKAKIPDIILRTSLMVGFPGEKEEEFNELVNFIKDYPFQRIGVFPYSREEGTSAAKLPLQIDEDVKEKRRSILMAHQQRISRRLNRQRIGKIYDVLVERKDSDNLYVGRSYGETPGIDGQIFIMSRKTLEAGCFTKVKISKAYEYDLVGEVYESSK